MASLSLSVISDTELWVAFVASATTTSALAAALWQSFADAKSSDVGSAGARGS
jgi:hypothetical protein